MSNVEIERKFLVEGNEYLTDNDGFQTIVQGYLSRDPEKTIRVRRMVTQSGKNFNYLTIKGKSSADGLSRIEIETDIDDDQAKLLMEMCDPNSILEKIRFIKIGKGSQTWEIDVFTGLNQGLVVAEIELQQESHPINWKPDYIGKEVTGDARYYNSNLISNPYIDW